MDDYEGITLDFTKKIDNVYVPVRVKGILWSATFSPRGTIWQMVLTHRNFFAVNGYVINGQLTKTKARSLAKNKIKQSKKESN